MYRGVTWRIVLCLAAMLLCASPARADYEAGQTAWQAGQHAEALAQWRAAARTGDGNAMLALGRAFVNGLGVPQDYILAHMWLNLAAGRGSAEAARERDALAANMVPQHIAEAQERARAWLSGRGTDAPKAAAVPSAAPPSTPTGPPPPRAIREAQGLMAALGYDPGPEDGRWGPRTGRAYTAFLRDAGLPPAEMLTPDSLRAMRAAAKDRNVAAATTSPTRAPASQRQADPAPADLHRLVAAGDLDGLKAALAKGADANLRDANGWTPLMHAADKGRTLLVPPLLKAGANPNIRASDGATALFMAAVHKHSEIITALMKAGADSSIKGPKGTTPADLARAAYGGLEAARRKGASPEVLALLEKGSPTPSEVEQQIKNDKQTIRRELLNCGMFPTSRDKYSNSENYYGRWQKFSRVTFRGMEMTIEVAQYEERSSKIKPSHPEGSEKYVYTFDILETRARILPMYKRVINPNTGRSYRSLSLEGNIRRQWKTWGADVSRKPLWLPETQEHHVTSSGFSVCDKVTAELVAKKLTNIREMRTALR